MRSNFPLYRTIHFLFRIAICVIYFCSISITCLGQNPTLVRGVQDSTAPNKFIGSQYALVVGVSKYRNIPRLLYADDDAVSFKDFLIDTKIVPEANIHMLIDSTATRSKFYAEIKKIMDKLKEKDRVIIYFAGHGDVDNDIDAGFLLGYNCEATPYAASDAIDISMLERYVDAITKKNVKVILISDACRSGKLTGGTHGAELTLTALSSRFKNSIKFMSCGPGELSEEKDFRNGGHGVFTYYLLQALYGLCDEDNNNIITKKEIDKFLRDKVAKATSDRQNPVTEGNANEVILDVLPELKLAMIAKAQTGETDNKTVAKRTFEVKKMSGVSFNDSVIIKKFYNQIRDGKLNTPEGDNAYETFLSAKKIIKNTEAINSMQYDLAAGLEDDVQPLLNRFTRGEFQDYPYDLFDAANKKLDIIKSELITPSDYRYNDIKALQIFFNKAGYYTDETLKELLKADSILPNTAYINCELARCYAERAMPDTVNALKYLRKSMRLAPTWPFPFFITGLMYMDVEVYDQAIYYFNKSLDIKKDFKLSLINLGVTYSRLKDHDKEISYYKKALAILKPDNIILFGDIGLYWKTREMYDSALYYYKKGYGLNHYNIFNLSGMIRTFIKLKQKDSALYYITKLEDTNPVNADDYRDIADVYLDVSNYDKAISFYKKAIDIKPSSYTYNNLGLTYDRMQNKEDAKKYYRLALQLDPNYSTSINNLTFLYDKMEQYDSAIFYYRQQYIRNPNDITNLSLMVTSFFKLKQKDSALFYKSKLESIATNDPADLRKIGDIYLDVPDYNKAISYYKKSVAIKPSPDAYNNLGLVYDYMKNVEEAKKYYRMAIALQPDYITSIRNMAILYNQLTQYDSALNYYRKLLVINSKDVSNIFSIAGIFNKLKQKDSAIYYLKKIEGIDLYDYNDMNKLGDLYLDVHEYKKAINNYIKAIAIKPDAYTYNNLGLAYENINNNEEAKKYYMLAIQLRPVFSTPLTNLAGLYYQNNEYDSAIAWYKRSLQLVSSSAVIYNSLGGSYLNKGIYDSAVVYYLKAIEKDATANNYVNLGHTYYLNQKYAEAVPYYEKALKLDSSYTRAYARLAYTYLVTKKYDDAVKWYQKALHIDSSKDSRSNFYYNMACARSLQVRKEDALSYFERSLQAGYPDLKHIEEDTDLDNIRSIPVFKRIIETYFKKEEIEKYQKLYK